MFRRAVGARDCLLLLHGDGDGSKGKRASSDAFIGAGTRRVSAFARTFSTRTIKRSGGIRRYRLSVRLAPVFFLFFSFFFTAAPDAERTG